MAASASSAMSIYLTTFNMNMRSAKLTDEDLRRWVAPAFKGEGGAPDLVVVGVQELLPLEMALAGWGRSALTTLGSRLHVALDGASASPGSYTLASSSLAGGVALFLFASESVAGRMSRPVVASVSLGDAGLSNKAATGLRVTVNRRGGGDAGSEAAWESFTFVSAHLSAHDYNLLRRNAEFASIGSSLQFPASSPLVLPPTIYDSSHTFVMGDLNYRLFRTPPMGHSLSVSRLDSDSPDDLRSERDALVALDTLKQEQAKGTAFVDFAEGDLMRFAPTYKRVIGQREGWSSKRIPGYTDRILWASASGVRAQTYESIEEITLSDHKPVICRVEVLTATSASASPHHTPRLQLDATVPTRTDQSLVVLYKTWGLAADRTVGYAWLLTLLLGGGKLKIGLAVEAVLLLGIAGYASGLLRI